jgi:predicted alpha-1,6-mannanase (GH76 family)
MKSLRLKSTVLLVLLMGLSMLSLHNNANAQLATFGPTAGALQNSSYSLFISASGNYFYQNNSGHTGFNYWWNAHGVDAFLDGYQRTRSSVYLTRTKNLVRGIKIKNGNTYNNTFIDDMEWLAISSLRAYDLTKDTEYLNVANELWGRIKNGFHGNSFQWNTSCPNCRNTCANTPAVIFAARLYRSRGNAADLKIAKDVFAWVKSVLVDPATGAVWDAYNAGTGSVGKSRYSYNQGTYIGAALELYKITGDLTYMNDAIKTADYAISNSINGVLYPNAGGGDGGLFNGILVRYLALLAREGNIPQSKKDQYINIIKSSAQTLKNQGINTSNMTVSPKWGVPPGNSTDYSSQLSGVMLIEAAATFDQVMVYEDITYGGVSAYLPVGNYTTSELQARGIANDKMTSLTIPAGYQVTVFTEDNFTGTSAVFTSNQTWLNTLNDRISSVRVAVVGGGGTFSETIEAEDYTSMSGVITEPCSEGGSNIGSFNTGDWTSYTVTIPTSGTYRVSYRVSSIYSGRTLRLEKDGGATNLGTINIPNTGSWQAWTSISHDVVLPSGTYSIRLATATGGLNVNRFHITNNLAARSITEATLTGIVKEENRYQAFPNPFKANAVISVSIAEPGHAEISVLNSKGSTLTNLHNGFLTAGLHQFELNGCNMPPGLYVYSVSHKGKRTIQKIIKE